MKKLYAFLSACLLCIATGKAQETDTTHVTIETHVGTMKAILLHKEVPNHVRTFISRARTANYTARQKALKEFYVPIRAELNMLKMSNKREYSKRMRAINAQIDSVIRATPGHLLFTDEQRKAYTTIGGCHHLDGVYTIYGEVIEGLEVIDQIATQPKDQYDRPKKDIRIKRISID